MTEVLTEGFPQKLFELSRGLFASILQRDAQDDKTWENRLRTFERNCLLNFTIPSPFKPKPEDRPLIDQERIWEDRKYANRVIRKLKAPRPPRWIFWRLIIDRSKLGEAEYLDEVAKLLAFRWAVKCVPAETPLIELLLMKQDLRSLTVCLDTMGNHQSDAKGVSDLVMRLVCEDCIDNNKTFQDLICRMKSELSKIRQEAGEEIAAICQSELEKSKSVFDAIAVDIAAKFDAAQLEVRNRAAADAARSSQVLAESAIPPGYDAEAEFRAAVRAREKAHREANKLTPTQRGLLTTTGIVVAGLLGYFLEINGVTPYEFVVDWLNYLF